MTQNKESPPPAPGQLQLQIDWDSNEAAQLRDRAWEDYWYKRDNKICSRCGSYNKYEIITTVDEIDKNLNMLYEYNFHEINYEIKTTTILTKNSNDSEWGNLCTKCREHILGRKPYPLDSSLTNTESEYHNLKQKELLRRVIQNDEISKVRREHNKLLRENGGPLHPPPRNMLNPSDDLRYNKGNRENWRAEREK